MRALSFRWQALLGPAPVLLVPCAIVVAAVVAVGLFGSPVTHSVAILSLVYLVLTVGTYVFVGNSGIVSFGQMSFMAVGAYASALLTVPALLKHTLLPSLPGWLESTSMGLVLATVLSGLVAAVLAVVLGKVLMRLAGISAGIASLALLLVAHNVINTWESVTRGTKTMIGIPTDVTLYGTMGFALAAIVIAALYQASSSGLRLRAAREDEVAARASGVRVARERLVAVVVSGFICGVGGSLLAHYQGTLTPTLDFFLAPTLLTLVMLVIGGIRSLLGAVVGAVVIAVLNELLRRLEQGLDVGGIFIHTRPGLGGIILGALMLVMLIVRPDGVTGSREARLPRLSRSRQ
jgi:branched-chain amino acid transport system permease protein